MEQPKTIKFSGLEINTKELDQRPNRGPMDRTWVRVQFTIPECYEAPDKVREWLVQNVLHHWSLYVYSDPTDMSYKMVIRFSDRNDALMFKLKGGHQIWEA